MGLFANVHCFKKKILYVHYDDSFGCICFQKNTFGIVPDLGAYEDKYSESKCLIAAINVSP